MSLNSARYIKIVGAKTGHLYHVEWYSEEGSVVDSGYMELAQIDQMTKGGAKLRVNTPWGIHRNGRILAVGLPKFLRS